MLSDDSGESGSVASYSQLLRPRGRHAAQALTWLDARNASRFENVSRSGNATSFSISAAAGARNNLQGLLPLYTSTSSLSALTLDGLPLEFTTDTVKGIAYARFPAASGSYVATYDGPPAPPPSGGGLSLWPATASPSAASVNDSAAVELGVKFRADVDGKVLGIRFYKGPSNTGTHVGTLWSDSGSALASATFTSETASGWQQVRFSAPVTISAGQTYVASYFAPNGGYAFDADYFVEDVVAGSLRALASDASGGNGVYRYGGGFPNQTFNRSNYWVDVLFEPAAQAASYSLWPPTTEPAVAAFPDTAAVELGVKFRADRTGRIAGLRFYKGAGNEGPHVGTLWSESGSALASATFTNETATGWQEVRFAAPVPIAAGTTYVASYFAPNGNYAVDTGYFGAELVRSPLRAPASAASGGNGVYRYGGGFPDASFNSSNYWVDVIFEDVAAAPTFSLWTPSALPSVPSFADGNAVELGVKFQADAAGEIVGVRFYKGAGNTGVHVGRLWNAAGTLLGSATFSNETASGWQEVRFSTPVPIAAGQTDVASYFAPSGGYAADAGYFFGGDVVAGPLRALGSAASGGNGVFRYGGGFPDASFNDTNYWVDVVFR